MLLVIFVRFTCHSHKVEATAFSICSSLESIINSDILLANIQVIILPKTHLIFVAFTILACLR